MSEIIANIERLREYLNGVIRRADDHADNVNEIVLTLIGAVIAVSTTEIKVRTYAGETANSIWFVVGENRYAMKYNHGTEQIDLLERNEQGRLKASFDNTDTAARIKNIFMVL